jgi:hypothetical protein
VSRGWHNPTQTQQPTNGSGTTHLPVLRRNSNVSFILQRDRSFGVGGHDRGLLYVVGGGELAGGEVMGEVVFAGAREGGVVG